MLSSHCERTPWTSAQLEALTGAKQVIKFFDFCWTQMFIIVLKRGRHWCLSLLKYPVLINISYFNFYFDIIFLSGIAMKYNGPCISWTYQMSLNARTHLNGKYRWAVTHVSRHTGWDTLQWHVKIIRKTGRLRNVNCPSLSNILIFRIFQEILSKTSNLANPLTHESCNDIVDTGYN